MISFRMTFRNRLKLFSKLPRFEAVNSTFLNAKAPWGLQNSIQPFNKFVGIQFYLIYLFEISCSICNTKVFFNSCSLIQAHNANILTIDYWCAPTSGLKNVWMYKCLWPSSVANAQHTSKQCPRIFHIFHIFHMLATSFIR